MRATVGLNIQDIIRCVRKWSAASFIDIIGIYWETQV
jgi:hypothetical protein